MGHVGKAIKERTAVFFLAGGLVLALLLIGSGSLILWADSPAPAVQIPGQNAGKEGTAAPARSVAAEGAPSSPTTSPLAPSATASPSLVPSPTFTRTPQEATTPNETSIPRVTSTIVLSPSASATPRAPAARDAEAASTPAPFLSQNRLVTYYGSPLGPELGILGTMPRDILTERLRETTAEYQSLSGDRRAMPTFHIITTVADIYPGERGSYSRQLSLEIIADWVAAARSAKGAIILDLQPGHASIDEEFYRIQYFLYSPHVHVALDSEFTMEGDQVPGRTLGQLYAREINQIQARLNDIAMEIGTNKVLIVHQFEGHMVPDKAAIVDYPYVELVFDADGFGSPQAKKGDYEQYASEPAFEYGGFKLFYDWDFPLMSPSQVLALDPPPSVVIYQ